MDWRVLVIDDEAAEDVKEVIQGNKAVHLPDSITCTLCQKFSDAVNLLKNERFDLVILDLKDAADPEGVLLAGEVVFDALKACRFTPVIFHTGFPNKVKDLASPYVKVVTRSEWETLRASIREIFDTKLPSLIRHIEEEQRKFMWESAGKIWVDDLDKSHPTDLVYLLARRLANALSGDVVRSFLAADGAEGAPQSEKIHAVELYVFPPISKHPLFGDVFIKETNGTAEYFVMLTPSCDLAQSKAEFVLLSKCKNLVDTTEGQNAKASLINGGVVSAAMAKELKKIMCDNWKPVDRYKYLPSTSFLPDLLVDFQGVFTVDVASFFSAESDYKRIASLDSPFAESLQAKMTRYLGRIGTPDIDADLTFERFKSKYQAI